MRRIDIDIDRIRDAYVAGAEISELAHLHGCSKSYIYMTLRGYTKRTYQLAGAIDDYGPAAESPALTLESYPLARKYKWNRCIFGSSGGTIRRHE